MGQWVDNNGLYWYGGCYRMRCSSGHFVSREGLGKTSLNELSGLAEIGEFTKNDPLLPMNSVLGPE